MDLKDRQIKVLFVFREELHIPNHLIRVQIQSLVSEGINIQLLPFYQGGIKGYISLYRRIRQVLKNKPIDIVHAHYGLTCLIAGLASKKPVIASLMGSDIKTGFIVKLLISFAYNCIWSATIVKSERMRRELGFNNLIVIPNGVSFSRFYPVKKEKALKLVKFNSPKNILFISIKPDATVKNFVLAKRTMAILNDSNVQLHIISKIPIESLVYYYNAADALLLTSLSEGSPNVVKEAMACNCPIVTTDVGDVVEVISDTEGCYICKHDEREISVALQKVLAQNKRTNGRTKIQHLSEDKIAAKIIALYLKILHLK